jgi:NADPH2:quinone reductase
VLVRVLAAGVSFTDAQIRAGTYIGGPKPPFTPGYELVGVVEELGPGCSRLKVGDRIGALTVWGADAERVCVPEKYAVEVPEDLDPAEVVSLVFPYMTAYQLLHRAAKAKRGETVLVHGAAGRVGTALLELGALAGLRTHTIIRRFLPFTTKGALPAGPRWVTLYLAARPVWWLLGKQTLWVAEGG